MSAAKKRPSARRRRPPKTRPREHGALIGAVKVARPGVAEVVTAEGTFPVARGGLREAMNGDKVGVTLGRPHRGERLARVQHVIERAVTSFLGVYELIEPLGAVRPLDERIRHDFFVLPDDTSAQRLDVRSGDVVVAKILTYPARGEAGVVTLTERVGSPEDVDVAIERVIANHDLPVSFPERAQEEARAVRLDVAETLASEPWRRDLRDLPLMTVDPATARDFDDAICVQRTDAGYELTVAIADVTHYVPQDSALDNEAKQRTCSCYLPDRVIPMLPEELSCGVCSLNPNEDRLAMVVRIAVDSKGVVKDAEPCVAAIRSRARMDYDAVDRFLEAPTSEKAAVLAEGLAAHVGAAEAPTGALAVTLGQSLEAADELAELRRRVRERRGAIDFDSEESKVELDEKGAPVGVTVRTRTRATGLVEEAMLLANECVAGLLASRDIKTAYRVHPQPSAEDLAAVVPVLKEFDLVTPAQADQVVAGDPHAIEAVLQRAEGTRYELLVSTLLVRAMQKAVYLPDNEGHYALGAKAYCHFTSPIRRYPDVLVHRTLKACLRNRLHSKEQKELDRTLSVLCSQCSEGERRASGAEWDAQAVKMAELYAGKIGEEAEGVVIGCERFGLFVRLADTGAEGLVPVRALGDEWFEYDEKRLTLTSEESHDVYRLGDPLTVRVHGVDIPKGHIDFTL
ncbi:ribonuclease R [Olsenella sp. YH-ols2217]|uniref:Ribonuclease R n=1 Tax=Kribbibacterium absianum TaxID=3044210 RepID=A0ABT6ZK28_9ACTN|nr:MULTISPECIES: ribonuclease R [unclassified Olsenella]MDJ1122356.1 ribonuclease R [Olsenella sp. YH-ols2216]MDJ1129390.1 ribonuclease R [Olsenella sp. YH-ols2217]